MKHLFPLSLLAIAVCILGCSAEGGLTNWDRPGETKMGTVKISNQKTFDSVRFNVIDEKVERIDSRTITVSGRITDAQLIFVEHDVQYEFTAGGGAWNSTKGWQKIGQLGPERKATYPWPIMHARLLIGQYGAFEGEDLKIDTQGRFSATLKSARYYFDKSNIGPFYEISPVGQIQVYARHTALTSSPTRQDTARAHNQSKEHRETLSTEIGVYKAKPNTRKINGLVDTLMNESFCRITIQFKEQTTRRNISTGITISPIEGISQSRFLSSMKDKLSRKLGNSHELLNIAMNRITSRYRLENKLWDQPLEQHAQTTTFVGLVGRKYQIESVHGEYYYFKGFVTPPSSRPVDKTVLLVEKGDKVRFQEVKEGEGGSIIDTN